MICDGCAKVALQNSKVVEEAEKHGTKNLILADHPENCGCPCQHRFPGSWKGTKVNAEARA